MRSALVFFISDSKKLVFFGKRSSRVGQECFSFIISSIVVFYLFGGKERGKDFLFVMGKILFVRGKMLLSFCAKAGKGFSRNPFEIGDKALLIVISILFNFLFKGVSFCRETLFCYALIIPSQI